MKQKHPNTQRRENFFPSGGAHHNNNKDQPRVPLNLVFSPVLGHLFFIPRLFQQKGKYLQKNVVGIPSQSCGGTAPTAPELGGQATPTAPRLPRLCKYSFEQMPWAANRHQWPGLGARYRLFRLRTVFRALISLFEIKYTY